MSAAPAHDPTSLTLVRHFKASPAKVYAAWTDPALMLRWWGPGAGPVVAVEADVREGGRFRITFKMKDGREHSVTGTYREVRPAEKLVHTWQPSVTDERQSLVTVLFRAVGGGTELTLTHERFADAAERDNHHEGWSSALDKVATWLAAPERETEKEEPA